MTAIPEPSSYLDDDNNMIKNMRHALVRARNRRIRIARIKFQQKGKNMFKIDLSVPSHPFYTGKQKIEFARRIRVRRAKLYYLRQLRGKAARIQMLRNRVQHLHQVIGSDWALRDAAAFNFVTFTKRGIDKMIQMQSRLRYIDSQRFMDISDPIIRARKMRLVANLIRVKRIHLSSHRIEKPFGV